jgi:hypothetical protein
MLVTPPAWISTEQDLLHAICGDRLLVATLLSIFELACSVSVSAPFWSSQQNSSRGFAVPD